MKRVCCHTRSHEVHMRTVRPTVLGIVLMFSLLLGAQRDSAAWVCWTTKSTCWYICHGDPRCEQYFCPEGMTQGDPDWPFFSTCRELTTDEQGEAQCEAAKFIANGHNEVLGRVMDDVRRDGLLGKVDRDTMVAYLEEMTVAETYASSPLSESLQFAIAGMKTTRDEDPLKRTSELSPRAQEALYVVLDFLQEAAREEGMSLEEYSKQLAELERQLVPGIAQEGDALGVNAVLSLTRTADRSAKFWSSQNPSDYGVQAFRFPWRGLGKADATGAVDGAISGAFMGGLHGAVVGAVAGAVAGSAVFAVGLLFDRR